MYKLQCIAVSPIAVGKLAYIIQNNNNNNYLCMFASWHTTGEYAINWQI
jgi:hypothetical protein